MTTTTKPAAIIETSRGPKLLECPYCGESDLIHTISAHHRDFITYRCIYCESGGYVLDLMAAPEPVDLTIDDTHARYGDIGPIAPPTLFRRAHCYGCDDHCKGINAGSNRPCPCQCH